MLYISTIWKKQPENNFFALSTPNNFRVCARRNCLEKWPQNLQFFLEMKNEKTIIWVFLFQKYTNFEAFL